MRGRTASLPGGRGRVDPRINALEVQTGSTTVRTFVGHSIEGTGGASVRGAARKLTLEARGEVWEATADTVLFAT